MNVSNRSFLSILAIAGLASISACGGGGGGDSQDTGPVDLTWTAGVFQDEGQFKNRCAVPRTTTDINGNPYPDQAGSTTHENHWLRSWSNNTYLWYDELPDLNPAQYSVPVDYFNLLKTSELTASGSSKDNFHFSMDTSEYEQRTQSGVSVSYGIDWLLDNNAPRTLFIRFIESGSPADDAALNLTRGAQVLEIDGVNVEAASTQDEFDILNAGISPSTDGESHNFVILDQGATQSRSITLTATEVVSDPVPIVDTFTSNSGEVGYIFFNDHNFVSEDKLFDAVTQLSNANVTDLILDLRYNGGGFLYIASQLSYMIAGNTNTNGKTFSQIRFNDKHTVNDPVTGATLSPTPFFNTSSQYSDNNPEGTALPSLNLDRVFILSSSGTCSASEAIINGLRGIDVEVILIGDTTCGKPYGFYATDNCGTTYFTIQFDGVNDKGVGGYSDGFSPMNTSGTVGELVTGCNVADDLSFTLGDQQEPMISAALSYQQTGTCPTLSTTTKSQSADKFLAAKPLAKQPLKLPKDLDINIYLDPYSQ